MDVSSKTRKEIGDFGERVAEAYFVRHGFVIEDRNVARKTGELDRIVRKDDVIHIVEVKTVVCRDFPVSMHDVGDHDPSINLHSQKLRKIARTAEWYLAERKWEGEWQVDGLLVWVRKHDCMARVRYLPQIW